MIFDVNCYNHPNQPAVAQCPDCGKGLCAECAAAYSIPICKTCNRKRIGREKGDILWELLLTFGIGITLAVLFVRFASAEVPAPWWFNAMLFVAAVYLFSGTVAGWRTLTRIDSDDFMIIPFGGWLFFLGWAIGWLLFLVIKLGLSAIVGLVMLPIRTVKNVSRLKTLSKVRT